MNMDRSQKNLEKKKDDRTIDEKTMDDHHKRFRFQH